MAFFATSSKTPGGVDSRIFTVSTRPSVPMRTLNLTRPLRPFERADSGNSGFARFIGLGGSSQAAPAIAVNFLFVSPRSFSLRLFPSVPMSKPGKAKLGAEIPELRLGEGVEAAELTRLGCALGLGLGRSFFGGGLRST